MVGYILSICILSLALVVTLVRLAFLSRKKSDYPVVGVLRIDTSNDEKDVYTLEVGYIPLYELTNYKEVAFRIETTDSHK